MTSHSKFKFNVGKSIRVAMAKREVHNLDIAETFNVSEMTVYRWKAKEDAPIGRTVKLANMFDMSFDEFIDCGL